jgi:membrane-associated phospholipid phosphatase
VVTPGLRDELHRLDTAVYAAIAEAPTPRLDRAMNRLSSAADYSRLSLASAGLLAVAAGAPGRRAAARGLVALALTAGVVNGLVKPLARRRRPDPAAAGVPMARRVAMPRSASFPSGHSAAAAAFALGVGRELPWAGVGLAGLATIVAYSRVHTGVHYPGDVVAGALCGLVGVAASDRVFESA